MKLKRIIYIVVTLIIVIGTAVGVKYYSELSSYRQAIEQIAIGEVDLSTIPDGVYSGSEDTVWVGANVQVTVEDSMIIAILLDHRHDRGEDAEVVTDRVIEAQSLQVDLVSGATSSSKVIIKAIENALRSAQ